MHRALVFSGGPGEVSSPLRIFVPWYPAVHGSGLKKVSATPKRAPLLVITVDPAAPEGNGLTHERDLADPGEPGSGRGLTYRDVVVACPPCGGGQAYTSYLDVTLLTGATLVAAPLSLMQAAIRVYKGSAAIVPEGTAVPGLMPARIYPVALAPAALTRAALTRAPARTRWPLPAAAARALERARAAWS